MTLYVILKQESEDEKWFELANVEASGTKTAIRSYLNDSPADGTFVAVPARSWHPIAAVVETKRQLRLT